MAQAAQILEQKSVTQKERFRQIKPQTRKPRTTIYANGSDIERVIDPPNDWLDDPLVALQRSRGPYTIDNADEYLDTEYVELYNGWLVKKEISDFNDKKFEGRLLLHLGGASFLLQFGDVLPDDMECHLSDGNVIKPDLSLISWDRMKKRVRPHGPNDRPTLMGSPELVVEVRSPSNRRAQEKKKRARYFRNGTEIIWDVDEKEEIIYVYRAGSQDVVETYAGDDEIDCEPLLPGWRRRVSDLFAERTSVEVVLSEVVETFQEKGREEGIEIGKQGMLIRLLQARFIDLPEQILAIIKQTHDATQLDSWFDQALMAQALDELPFSDGP